MKPTILKSLCAAFALFTMLFTSCNDDFPYLNGDIPEGEGTLSATVTFHPASSVNLGGTRTAGNAIQSINSLCVLVYYPNGNLMRKYTQTELKNYQTGTYNVDQDKDHLDGTGAEAEEAVTAKATFTLPDLPYGTYKIYAVANMGDMSAYSEDIKTEEGLKRISLNWNANNVPANAQMFGYFTPSTNMDQNGFNAPPIVFKQPNTEIHAWLKRAASKVTVAFDPSGLKDRIWIYVKSVTIMDLPKNCLLGEENRPDKADQLLNHVGRYDEPSQTSPTIANSDVTPNTRLWYNKDGVVTEVSGAPNLNDKRSGLELTNSRRIAIPANAHDADAPSLFFFENNQTPNYDGMSKTEKKKYEKVQQHSKNEDGTPNPDGVGSPIREDNGMNDFKDRVPYGTYVEVEAYYISENPGKTGQGPIKYRFMLGKDITYNYDAQRNYHFKLTLGFRGYANEPDWHIDYEEDPYIEVPEVFRVSYLYHQSSELPIRIHGNCTELKVEIIENNWAPYDPDGYNGYEVPAPETAEFPDKTYEFKWNYQAYKNEYMESWEGKERQKPWFGFLCLHLPDRKTTSVDIEFNKPDAFPSLKNYYEDNYEGERIFSEERLAINDKKHPFHYISSNEQSENNSTSDDKYKVNPVLDDEGKPIEGQKTLMLPLWTRAKTLILDSGFSGNNPYEAFERKARLRITANFDNGVIIKKTVTVFQVKRIVNPKGVWRSYDSNAPFDVTLLEAISANGKSDFQPFVSEGEWTAFIEAQSNSGGFSLSTNGETVGYEKKDSIHGYTGSKICFRINFNNTVAQDQSQCAIVKILYHGNQCMHKILVRKGYNNPIQFGDTKWSSFSLYKATRRGNGTNNEYNVELTQNPLMLGSMYKRGNLIEGIPVSNNQQLGPFLPPGTFEFTLTNGAKKTWSDISYVNINTYPNSTLGTFYAGGQTYRVPTFDDFKYLTDHCEYGYGVFYGSAATEPQTLAEEAYGLIDPNNNGEATSKQGMRGVVAYNNTTGDQIFFPMGKYGTGRRKQFNVRQTPSGTNESRYYGELRYSDVDYVLSGSDNYNRPIPYNLPIACGNIYWIDQLRAGGGPSNSNCLGWDMNYFNFDFNPYTSNNMRDACPIKFVVVE